jgi:Big-like domain-containing protein
MKNWAKQLAGAVLVLVFALAVGGFVMVLRAQQQGLAATMAADHIRAVSPPDGATNVPVTGELRAEYVSRPTQDPAIKLEPPPGVTLSSGHWDGSTFILPYSGLRENSLYHAELDQDVAGQKGEHKQVKVRWSFRTGTGQHATPSPSPTSVAPSISASPSVTPTTSGPLIWYRGPTNDLHGLDWTGKQVKNLSPGIMIQSPDGFLLWRRPNIPASSSAVSNSDGNPVGSVVAVDQNMTWADDSQQFCGVTSTPAGSYALEMLRINGPRDPIGAINLPRAPAQVPVLAACSVLTRRALVIGQSSGYTWSSSLISLADGSVIYQRSYPNPLARIVASHDGQYIAEQLASNANGGPVTLIRQLPSGTVVGQLSGILVQGFSWDGSLVVGSTFGNPSVQEAQVIRWRTHEAVWHQCMCPHPHWLIVLAQPSGTKVAVVASTDDGLHVSFNIVDANGASQPVPIGNTPITPAF